MSLDLYNVFGGYTIRNIDNEILVSYGGYFTIQEVKSRSVNDANYMLDNSVD